MALTVYTLDASSIGAIISPADAFVVNLMMTQAPNPSYDVPDYDPGRQRWKTARFVLRGTGDIRDLLCIDCQSGGGWASHYGHTSSVLADASYGYRGELEIVCVQRGSVWSLTLSDQPYVRAPPPWPPVIAPRKPPPPEPVRPHDPRMSARKAGAILEAARQPAE